MSVSSTTDYQQPHARSRGPLLAVGAAFCFAISIPLGKWLLGDLSAFTLSGLLYLGSGLGLTAYRALVRRPLEDPADTPIGQPVAERRRSLIFLIAGIVVGGVIAPLLLFRGLSSTPAVMASLLMSLEVVLTALIARPFFHEHVAPRVWAALGLMLAAAAMMGWSRSGWTWSAGAIMVALATLLWALDNNLTREISTFPASRIVQLKGLTAGSVNLAIGLMVSGQPPALLRAVVALLLGAVSYGLGLVLFIGSLRILGSARTGSYFATAPLIAAVLSVVLFRQAPPLRLAGAFIAVGLAVALMVTESHSHEHSHGAEVHSHWHWPDQGHRHEH